MLRGRDRFAASGQVEGRDRGRPVQTGRLGRSSVRSVRCRTDRHQGRRRLFVVAEDVRDGRDVDVGHAPERPGDGFAGPVVKEAVPDAAVLQLRHQHADLGVAPGEELRDDLDRASSQTAVGTVDDVEGETSESEALPGIDEVFRADRIEIEVDSPQLVGLLAYWMARADATSRRSTKTRTT